MIEAQCSSKLGVTYLGGEHPGNLSFQLLFLTIFLSGTEVDNPLRIERTDSLRRLSESYDNIVKVKALLQAYTRH
jgi:hypothetical protein